MVNNHLHPVSSSARSTHRLPILDGKQTKNCHITLPDLPKPVSAILYDGKLYSYVRFYSNPESAKRACERLAEKGNLIALTQVRKGLILWVFEPDAQLASSSKL